MNEKTRYDVIRFTERTGYIDSPMLIPFYLLGNGRCVLMDTGSFPMRNALEQTLEQEGLRPAYILGTHTHFDHYGSTGYFANTYGAKVYLPAMEADVSRTIASVKSYLYCYSDGQVRRDANLAAIPCEPDHLIRSEEEEVRIEEEVFRIIHTPGHSIGHISIITPDGVCYAGDALMSGHSLHASKLPYAFHMQESLNSMDKLRSISSPYMILAHRGVQQAPYDEIVEENLQVMKQDIAEVAAIIDHPMTVEEITRKAEDVMGIRVDTVERALFLERFLRPYLEHLIDTGSHRQNVRSGILCYEPCGDRTTGGIVTRKGGL